MSRRSAPPPFPLEGAVVPFVGPLDKALPQACASSGRLRTDEIASRFRQMAIDQLDRAFGVTPGDRLEQGAMLTIVFGDARQAEDLVLDPAPLPVLAHLIDLPVDPHSK